ncbi:aKG-HExxH-type peptide beta-hydroxylase [Actinoplanes sp. NPDC048796]|uniref:aKG-HExxH-type peptide beta-hydroxylase n=1 Tax=Actinoplanes sp. NPDC048796 TaxID=3155640 RepID=UPI0033E52316
MLNERPAPVAGDLGALPADVFDRVAAGYGDAAAVGLLADAELAVNRALVSEILGETAAGGELLAELERAAPAAFDAVLSHPFVRSWAVACLEGKDAEPDRAAAIAAAVAVRAGADADVQVHAHDGLIHLPTVGVFAAPAEQVRVTAGRSSVVLRWPGGRAELPAGDRQIPGWHACRWVSLDGVRVLLDDADPYRDRLEFADPAWLDADGERAWAARLAATWERLAADAPAQLDGLRGGLRAIVPLAAAPDGTPRGATSRHAFGAVGLSPTADPGEAALLLVREFQLTKIGAVLDLIDLVPEDAVSERLAVGWHDDPRPVEAALRGAYAHLAVADVWRHRALSTGDPASRGVYRRYRDWTAEAIDTLLTGDRLTEAGTRFTRRMAATLDEWSHQARAS